MAINRFSLPPSPSPSPFVGKGAMGKFFYSAKMKDHLLEQAKRKYQKERDGLGRREQNDVVIPPGINTIHGNEYTCFIPNGMEFAIHWDDVHLVCEGCIDDAKFTPLQKS